jgi:hypothetical protein
MPTGYTHDIKNGISFEQFVMNCAKAFGACITMRDESSDTPIPEKFEPSSYNKKALDEANTELKEFEFITDEEWKEKTIEYNKERLQEYNKRLEENKRTIESYKNMLEKVVAWNPPTSEHVGLRDFMIQQIRDSIEWDNYEPDKPKEITSKELKDIKYQSILNDISYHSKAYAEEIDRTNSRNIWIEQLRESLKKENNK